MTSGGRLALALYAVAFVSVLAALGSLLAAVHGFLQQRWPLWLSVGLSAIAIVLALAGFFVDRRRTTSGAPGRDAPRS